MYKEVENVFWGIIERVNAGDIDIRNAVREMKKIKIQNTAGSPKKIDTRKIHELKKQGLDNMEIAMKMKISLTSVFRELKKNISDDLEMLPPIEEVKSHFYFIDDTGKRVDVSQEEAKRIRVNIEKVRENEAAIREVEYLEQGNDKRIDKNKVRDDLAYLKVNNMPEWANEEAVKNGTSPQLEFFKASQEYEMYNRRANTDPPITYRELKIALPEDLTTEQNIELVKDIMQKIGLDNMTSVVAIHDKPAQLMKELGLEVRNKHVHIMWSDRIPDEYKRDKEHYFSNGEKEGRYKTKNPAQGTCKKDPTYTQKGQANRIEHLNKIRKTVEQTINDHYKKHEIDKWVFSGTKEELMKVALERGDIRAQEFASTPNQRRLTVRQTRNDKSQAKSQVLEIKKDIQDIRDRHIKEDLQQAPEFYDKETREYAAMNPDPIKKILEVYNIPEQNINNLISNQSPLPLVDSDSTSKQTPTTESIKELEESVNSFNLQIEEAFKKLSDSMLDSNDKLNSRAKLQEELTKKQRAISKDPYRTAVRKCVEKEMQLPKKEVYQYCEKYFKDKDSIKWHKDIIAEREATIISRYYKTDTKAQAMLLRSILEGSDTPNKIDPMKVCSNRERKGLETLHRKLSELEKSTTQFEKKYINPNKDIIADLQQKSIKQNNDLNAKIEQLQTKLQAIQKIQSNPTFIELKKLEAEIKELTIRATNTTSFNERTELRKQMEVKQKEADKLAEKFVKEREQILKTSPEPAPTTPAPEQKQITPTSKENIIIDFTARTAQAFLSEQIKSLEAESRIAKNEADSLFKEIVTISDARQQAKEEYLGEPYKAALTEKKDIEIEEKTIVILRDQYLKAFHEHKDTPKPSWYQSEKLSKYNTKTQQLEEQNKIISKRNHALSIRSSTNKRLLDDLELKSLSSHAKEQIEIRARKIIDNDKSNNKIFYNKAREEYLNLDKKIATLKEQQCVIDKLLKQDITESARKNLKSEAKYSVEVPYAASSGNSLQLSAISRLNNSITNPKAVSLRANIFRNDKEDEFIEMLKQGLDIDFN